jgi:Fe-S-cluster containining protein
MAAGAAESIGSPDDCRRCGACCVNPPDNRAEGFAWWVEVIDGDGLLAKPDLVRKLLVRDADGVPHLRLVDGGRCAALRGSVGRAVRCGIYRDRPTPCRVVQPGDALCLRYRRAAGR